MLRPDVAVAIDAAPDHIGAEHEVAPNVLGTALPGTEPPAAEDRLGDSVPAEESAIDVVEPNGAQADSAITGLPTKPAMGAYDSAKLDGLSAAIDRLFEQVRADQDVIGRMQSRIEALQGDQVRALLGSAVTELATLHAALAESAVRDYERLGLGRVRKEFALLADHLESAIDVLGAVSVGAHVGDVFDSRAHQAVKQVPTADPALDKRVAAVVRQGFTFRPEGKPALYARVRVYSYDPALRAPTEAAPPPIEPTIERDVSPVGSCAIVPAETPSISEGELELPFPLTPSEDS